MIAGLVFVAANHPHDQCHLRLVIHRVGEGVQERLLSGQAADGGLVGERHRVVHEFVDDDKDLRDALRHLERMRRNADWTTGHGLALLAQMRADYVINTERWDSPSLQWRIDLTHARSRARAEDAFVAGFSALKRGDRAAAAAARADLTALNRTPPAPETGYVDSVPEILDKELAAAFRQAEGALDGAIALMREAVSVEDAMPLEFGPPAVVKPSHELLGEMLLQAGRSREAQTEFARALRLAPKRALALRGLARAAAAAGDDKTAAGAYAELRRIWHRADPDIPGLAEAARFLAARARS